MDISVLLVGLVRMMVVGALVFGFTTILAAWLMKNRGVYAMWWALGGVIVILFSLAFWLVRPSEITNLSTSGWVWILGSWSMLPVLGVGVGTQRAHSSMPEITLSGLVARGIAWGIGGLLLAGMVSLVPDVIRFSSR